MAGVFNSVIISEAAPMPVKRKKKKIIWLEETS